MRQTCYFWIKKYVFIFYPKKTSFVGDTCTKFDNQALRIERGSRKHSKSSEIIVMEMKSFDDYSKTAKLIYTCISEIFFDDIVITKQVYLS